MFCLAVYGHCLVLLIQDVVQNDCKIIICLTVCFSHSIMWLLKQVIFTAILWEKSHKVIYVNQNASLGRLKHTIPEKGQRSNECKL